MAALALVVYLLTLAPTITWRNDGADSGDLVAAAYTLGVPHPPGYPLYTLVSAGFAHLPWGEPARNVALFSALAAVTAAILLYCTIRLVLPDPHGTRKNSIIAASVALAFAFSPLFWSQATIAEVYALNLLLAAALLLVAMSRHRHRLVLAAVILGLGLAHHLSIVLLVPTALLLLSGSFERRAMLRAAALLVVPLLFYLYLPLRAAAEPPINWGDAKTLQGLEWAVTAAPYRQYLFNLTASDMLGRAALSARLLFEQFSLWGVGLALWGLVQMLTSSEDLSRRRARALVVGFGLIAGYAVIYSSRDSYIYLLPGFFIVALWIAYGIWDILRRLRAQAAAVAVAGALVLLPGSNLAANFAALDLSGDRTAYDYARSAITSAPGDSILFADGDERLFSLWYYRYVVAADSTVTVISPELLQYDWYYAQVGRTIPRLSAAAVTYDERVAEIIRSARQLGRQVWATTATGLFATMPTKQMGVLYQVGQPSE